MTGQKLCNIVLLCFFLCSLTFVNCSVGGNNIREYKIEFENLDLDDGILYKFSDFFDPIDEEDYDTDFDDDNTIEDEILLSEEGTTRSQEEEIISSNHEYPKEYKEEKYIEYIYEERNDLRNMVKKYIKNEEEIEMNQEYQHLIRNLCLITAISKETIIHLDQNKQI
jgi:hypothetical protein